MNNKIMKLYWKLFEHLINVGLIIFAIVEFYLGNYLASICFFLMLIIMIITEISNKLGDEN